MLHPPVISAGTASKRSFGGFSKHFKHPVTIDPRDVARSNNGLVYLQALNSHLAYFLCGPSYMHAYGRYSCSQAASHRNKGEGNGVDVMPST